MRNNKTYKCNLPVRHPTREYKAPWQLRKREMFSALLPRPRHNFLKTLSSFCLFS